MRLCKQFTQKTRSRRLSGTQEPDSSSAESSSSSDEEEGDAQVLDGQMRAPTGHEQLQQEQTGQIENATMQEKFKGQPPVPESAVPAAPMPSIEPSAPEVPAPPLSPICLSDEESSQKTLQWDAAAWTLDHVDGTAEVVQPHLQMVVALEAVAVVPEPPAPASAPEAAPLPAPMVEPPEPLVPVPAPKRGLDAIDLLDDSDDDPCPKKSRWAFEFVGLLDKMQRTAKRLASSVADDLQEVVPSLAEELADSEPGLAEPGLAEPGLAEPVLAEPEPGLAEPGLAPDPELPFEPEVFQKYRKTTARKGTIRSYVQGAGRDGKWKLIAEIKAKQCEDHVKIIEDVLAECKRHSFTSDQARACAAQKLASALASL